MDDNRNAATKKLCKSTAWVTPSFGDFGATGSVSLSNKPCGTQSELPVKKTQSFITKFQATCQAYSSKPQSSTGLTSTEEIGSDREKPRVMFPAHKLPARVKTEAQRRKLKSALNSELWSEKYQPKNRDELAVHKKKTEEILLWLRNNITNVAKHSAPILLLTGPSGIGKTAAVKTLASELRLDLQEWVNPVIASSDAEFQPLNHADIAERSSVDIYTSHSQSTLFSNFLLRANKYCALQFGTTVDTPAQNRIILVEEIPYAFYKDQSSLHEILRKYHFCGRCPLVFVLSDTSSSGSSILRLFPKQIMEELKIETISMNPVAPTMMVKVLNRIISQEAKSSLLPMLAYSREEIVQSQEENKSVTPTIGNLVQELLDNHQVKVKITVNSEPKTSLGKRLAKKTPDIPCCSVFMNSIETRLQTFKNHPDFQNGLITSEEVKRLASDGYFYARGRIECFYCGLRQDLPHDANCLRKFTILNQARPDEPMDM